jgi:hypothetical protein
VNENVAKMKYEPNRPGEKRHHCRSIWSKAYNDNLPDIKANVDKIDNTKLKVRLGTTTGEVFKDFSTGGSTN